MAQESFFLIIYVNSVTVILHVNSGSEYRVLDWQFRYVKSVIYQTGAPNDCFL